MTDPVVLVLAFQAGVATFFSPCGFPMLPAYVAHYLNLNEPSTGGAFTARNLGRGLLGGALAGLGALLVIASAGGLAVWLGRAFKDNLLLLELVGGALLVGLGILTLLDRGPSIAVAARPGTRRGYLSLALFGALYAAVAAGCVAPIFLSVLLPAFTTATFAEGMGIILAYAAGMVGLLVLVTVLVATTKGALVQKMRRALPHVKRAGGVVMIAVGLYLIWFWAKVAFLLAA